MTAFTTTFPVKPGAKIKKRRSKRKQEDNGPPPPESDGQVQLRGESSNPALISQPFLNVIQPTGIAPPAPMQTLPHQHPIEQNYNTPVVIPLTNPGGISSMPQSFLMSHPLVDDMQRMMPIPSAAPATTKVAPADLSAHPTLAPAPSVNGLAQQQPITSLWEQPQLVTTEATAFTPSNVQMNGQHPYNHMVNTVNIGYVQASDTSWMLEGHIELTKSLVGCQSMQELCHGIISVLVTHLRLYIGEIYAYDQDDELLFVDSFPQGKRVSEELQYQMDSMVSKVAIEKQTICFRVPNQHGVPCCVLTIPLKHNNEVKAVLVLSTFSDITPSQLTFLAQATKAICLAIDTTTTNSENLAKLQAATKRLKTLQDHSRDTYRREMAQRCINNALNCMLAAASDTSFIVTDTNGVVTYYNSGAEKLFGWKASEVVGLETPFILMNKVDLYNRLGVEPEPDDDPNVQTVQIKDAYRKELFWERLMAPAKQGETDRTKWKLMRKDGSSFVGDVTITSVKEGDKHVGYLGVTRLVYDCSGPQKGGDTTTANTTSTAPDKFELLD